MSDKKLVEINHIVKEFPVTKSVFGNTGQVVHAVSDVSLHIYEGETLGLVGESGCGKSTLGRLALNLLPPTGGDVAYDGVKITGLSENRLFPYRRKMQIIFQDPYSSLNPRMSVQQIIAEGLTTHKIYKSKKETDERVKDLLRKTGIRPEFMNRYPHQFSGGQRQRVGIARALALEPKFIVCDEPVSALDVSIQSQILNLLHDLQSEMGLTYMFISHDLSVVRYISDRVCVMFLGKMCECGPTRAIYEKPLHPYTQFLLEAVPKPDPDLKKEKKQMLSGEIPSPVNPPPGCRFHTRCPYKRDVCSCEAPPLKEAGENRVVACHLI